MTYGKLKDIVRSNIGQSHMSKERLDHLLESARRLIENTYNFHWMEAHVEFNLVVAQQTYPITVATSNGLNLPAYKDLKALYVKDPASSLWSEVEITDFQQTVPKWAVDDGGEPEQAVLENVSISVFPPLPDKAYNMLLHYWQWTSNPTSNATTDELLTLYPELLIYGATAHGLKVLTKNQEEYGPWEQMFQEELLRARRTDVDRHGAERINFTPRRGPFLVR